MDEKNMMLSVHLISYNHGPYIAQALDGILLQKVDFPMEVVVSDDCSQDNTAQIISEYARRYPQLIKPLLRMSNVGCVVNYWENYRRCSGKYVALCDGDDYWTDPLKLQKQVDYLEAHPECGLTYTDLDCFLQNENRLAPFPIDRLGEYAYDAQLMELRGIWTVTVCLRKELLLNMPALDDSCFRGDTWIWLEISRKSLVHFIPDKTAVYRILPESVSHIRNRKKEADFLNRVGNVYLYYARNFPSTIPLINQSVLRKWNLRKLTYAVWYNDYGELQKIALTLFPIDNIKQLILYIIYRSLVARPLLWLASWLCNRRRP